jgi:autotransporter-associated beta strand protein
VDLTNINLVKAGTGSLVLTGNMDYSGSTSVTGGTLIINGGISGTPPSGGIEQTSGVSVSSGATLAGHGVISVAPGGQVVVGSGGTISPGDNYAGDSPIGALTIYDPNGGPTSGTTFDLESGGTLHITLQAGGGSQLVVSGSISLAGNLTGDLLSGFTASPGDLFFIIINQGGDAIGGAFAGSPTMVSFSGPDGTIFFNVGYTGDSTDNQFTGGYDVVLQVSGIPEPGSAKISVAALALLFTFESLRRKRHGYSRIRPQIGSSS